MIVQEIVIGEFSVLLCPCIARDRRCKNGQGFFCTNLLDEPAQVFRVAVVCLQMRMLLVVVAELDHHKIAGAKLLLDKVKMPLVAECFSGAPVVCVIAHGNAAVQIQVQSLSPAAVTRRRVVGIFCTVVRHRGISGKVDCGNFNGRNGQKIQCRTVADHRNIQSHFLKGVVFSIGDDGRNIDREADGQHCSLPQRAFPCKMAASVENQKLFFLRAGGQRKFHAVISGVRNRRLEAERNESLRRLDCTILFPQRLHQCIRIQKTAVFVLLDFGDYFRCAPIRNIEPTIQFKNVQLRLCVVGSFVHEAKRLAGTIERDGILCALFQRNSESFRFHNASSISEFSLDSKT